MTSLVRIEANRANARLSTGLRSAEGKAVSAVNATRHGVFTAVPVVRGEDPAAWEDHRVDTLDALAPVGAVEVALAERVALALWRLGRLARYEALTTATDQDDARLPRVDPAFEDEFTARPEPATPPLERAIRHAGRKAADAKKLLASVGPAAEYMTTFADRADDDPAPPGVADRVFRAAFDVVAEFQRADDPPTPGSAKLAAAVGHPGVKPSAVPWTAGLIRKGLVYRLPKTAEGFDYPVRLEPTRADSGAAGGGSSARWPSRVGRAAGGCRSCTGRPGTSAVGPA